LQPTSLVQIKISHPTAYYPARVRISHSSRTLLSAADQHTFINNTAMQNGNCLKPEVPYVIIVLVN